MDVYDDDNNKIGSEKVPKMIKVFKECIRPKISLFYDSEIEYKPRSVRPEWNVVGLIGVVKNLSEQIPNNKWFNIKDDKWLIK